MKTTKIFMFITVLLIAGSISAYAEGSQEVIDILRDAGQTGGSTRAPGAPTGVTAARNPAGSTDVRVSWNAVSGATSYRVYWSQTNSGNGDMEGEPTTTSFTSTGNNTTRTHYFRVSAVNSAGEGAPSSWVTVGPVTASGTPAPTPTPTPTPTQSGGPSRWTAVSNTRFGTSLNDILGIAYGNGRFVAVGEAGKMAYSADGATWTAVARSPFSDTIRAIAYGGNRFVAVGDGGMAYSADGVTWTAARNNPISDRIYGVAWGSNRFVAGGENGVAYSADGVTWTRVTNSTVESIEAIAYGGGRFVAVGYDSSYNNIFAYSTDGARWTTVPNNVVDFDATGVAIAYGNNRFLAGGYGGVTAYSTDGARWTAASGNQSNWSAIGSLVWGNNRWVAGGMGGGRYEFGGYMAYSADGITWTPIADSPFDRAYSGVQDIAYASGRFVAVSNNGRIAYCDW